MHSRPWYFCYAYDLSFWTTYLDFLYLCFWPLPTPWMPQLKDLISEYWIEHVTMEFFVSKLYSQQGYSTVVFQALQPITLEVFRAMHWPLASRMLVYLVLNDICSVSGIEWIICFHYFCFCLYIYSYIYLDSISWCINALFLFVLFHVFKKHYIFCQILFYSIFLRRNLDSFNNWYVRIILETRCAAGRVKAARMCSNSIIWKIKIMKQKMT